MKRAIVLAAIAASFTMNAAASDAPVAVNVDGLSPNIAKKVLENAQRGERALARYLETTRPYHQLTLHDVTQPRAEASQQKFDPEREYRRHAHQWHKSVHVTG